MKEIKIIVIGAGSRGEVYSSIIRDAKNIKVIGVAELRKVYRDKIVNAWGIPPQNVFSDYHELLAHDKLADAVIIALQDRMHVEAAIAFADRKYHILLEKPMAPTAGECRDIVMAAKKNNIILAVCHVLRFTPFTRKVKELVDSGIIGEIVSIEHLEQVAFWHYAHSYVRGNWRNAAESSPMLLAKSCHDIDWIRYIMNCSCEKVSSFGSLYHFRPENKPKGAADRCLDCPVQVEARCQYSARSFYFKYLNDGCRAWPINILTPEPTPETLQDALRDGPYGRCVYSCDNDVVDHQVVNMQFANGKTASFTLMAFTRDAMRQTRIFGTRGEIVKIKGKLEVSDFLTGKVDVIDPNMADDGTIISGHGGGDAGVINAFIDALRHNDPSRISSGPEISLESHLMVFAAEKARAEDRIVRMSELI